MQQSRETRFWILPPRSLPGWGFYACRKGPDLKKVNVIIEEVSWKNNVVFKFYGVLRGAGTI